MSSDNRPEDEQPEDQQSGDETPEEVEAEIVDEEAEATRKAAAGDDADDDVVEEDAPEASAADDDTTADSDDDAPAKEDNGGGGMMSPGIILLVVLVLLAGFSVLSHLTRQSGIGADHPALAEEGDNSLTATLDEPPAPAKTDNVSDTVKQASAGEGRVTRLPGSGTAGRVTQLAEDPDEESAADRARKLREEAAERARQRREAASGQGADSSRGRVTMLADAGSADTTSPAPVAPVAPAAPEEPETPAVADAPEAEEAPAETVAATEADSAAERARELREEAIARARAARERLTGEEPEAAPEEEPAEDPAETAEPAAASGEPSQAQLAQQRREAAAERMRERREAAASETTEEPVAPSSAAEPSAETEAAIAEAREALSAQRAANARQSQEIDTLRRELDTALAEQDRRSEQRIAALEQRIERLQSQEVAAATRQAATALAVSNLQRQMYTGRPFKDQLAVLESLTGENQAIRNLDAYAEEGLPPLSYLQYTFPEAARQALAASRREEATGPLGKFWANLTGLFSVRRVTPQSGDNPSAIISRAEASLEEGDLESSLRELRALDGEAKAAMSSWMEEARARVAADRLLDNVSNDVLSRAG